MVWHWEETASYDSQAKTGYLFTSYINKAIKDKQEASGLPKNVSTDKKIDDYIKRYYDREGILLEKDKIKKNTGLRQVAKLMANSEWGFLAMQTNKIQFRLVRTLSEWLELITNDLYIV